MVIRYSKEHPAPLQKGVGLLGLGIEHLPTMHRTLGNAQSSRNCFCHKREHQLAFQYQMVSSENITELESMKIIFLFPLYDLLSLPSLPLESHSSVFFVIQNKNL